MYPFISPVHVILSKSTNVNAKKRTEKSWGTQAAIQIDLLLLIQPERAGRARNEWKVHFSKRPRVKLDVYEELR